MAYVDPLAALLRTSDGGQVETLIISGFVTTWNFTTGANTTNVNGVTYTDLPFVGPPADGGAGPVLLVSTPGGPVILGPLKFPPV